MPVTGLEPFVLNAAKDLVKWLGEKIGGKFFDTIFDAKLKDKDSLTRKFSGCVKEACEIMASEHKEIPISLIKPLFKDPEILDQLMLTLAFPLQVDLEALSARTNLSQAVIVEFTQKLRIFMMRDRDLAYILTSAAITEYFEGWIDPNKADKLLAAYRTTIISNLRNVYFLGLGIDDTVRKNRKQLEDIFVEPTFNTSLKEETATRTPVAEKDTKTIPYSKLLGQGPQLVILGKPGSGKSFLVQSLMYGMAKSDYIPFRIRLREYLAFRQQDRGNLLDHLRYILRTEYGLPESSVTEKFLLYLLRERKKVYFFFDGFDEIFDISRKIDIRNDIENLHNHNPGISSIVTSRAIGYEEVSFSDRFKELRICPFDDNQIKDYLMKWYDQEEPDKAIRDTETLDFLTQSKDIERELITNPLLLSLIIILFRNNKRLPESKLDIYQSCTRTLVDNFDKLKLIEVGLDRSILASRDKLFSDLAYWQYEQLTIPNGSVDYKKARATIARSLVDRCKIDEDRSEEMANGFLEYAHRRSIYYDNNFTHKTFLEYYAAYWIYSNVEKKHDVVKRNDIISRHIANTYWSIVLELLLYMIDKDQGDTEVIDSIFEQQEQLSKQALPFLIATLPNLSNIGDHAIATVCRSAVEFLLADHQSIQPDMPIEPFRNQPTFKVLTVLKKLFNANGDPRKRKWVLEALRAVEGSASHASLARLYFLYLELQFPAALEAQRPFELNTHEQYVLLVTKDSKLFYFNSWVFQKTDGQTPIFDSLVDFARIFPPGEFFKPIYATFLENFYFSPLDELIWIAPQPGYLPKVMDFLRRLETAGISKDNVADRMLQESHLLVYYGTGQAADKELIAMIDEAKGPAETRIMLCLTASAPAFGTKEGLQLIHGVSNPDKQTPLLQLHGLSKAERITFIRSL